MSLAIVIPAAGCSSRLGQLKQLVSIGAEPLLVRTIRTVSEAAARLAVDVELFVVLGYEAKQITRRISPYLSLNSLPVNLIVNSDWQSGIGSSISFGVSHLQGKFDAALVVLGDQWALSSPDFDALLQQWVRTPQKLVASCYGANCFGVPAIFPQTFFSALIEMKSSGAKRLIKRHIESTQFVDIERAIFDLDTPEQLQYLRTTLFETADHQPTLRGDNS